MTTTPYTATAEWHGGEIIVSGDKEGFAIVQRFAIGAGPAPSTGGEFPLGWYDCRHPRRRSMAMGCREATAEAIVHAKARFSVVLVQEADFRR